MNILLGTGSGARNDRKKRARLDGDFSPVELALSTKTTPRRGIEQDAFISEVQSITHCWRCH